MKRVIKTCTFLFVCFCAIFLVLCDQQASAASKKLSKVPKKVTVYTNENLNITKKFKLPYRFKHVDDEYEYTTEELEISTSNSKLEIQTSQDTSDDSCWEERYGFNVGNKTGKCTVTFKYIRHKTTYDEVYNDETEDYETNSKSNDYTEIAKCIVIIKRHPKLKLDGELINYNTRDNIYEVYIQNLTSKTITIYSNAAKALDNDYKKFDRKLKLSGQKKYIKIKPGKKKTVRFKVLGRNTWPNIKDTSIYFNLKYNKKKYKICVDTTGVYRFSKRKYISLAPKNELAEW